MASTISISIFGKNPIRDDYEKRIGNALRSASQHVKNDFETHSAGFSGGLDIRVDERRRDQILVFSQDQRLVWTALGAEPHTITARTGGSLAFSSNFVAATTPNTIPAQAATYGGNTVYRNEVKHPGVEPRNTQKALADSVRPALKKLIREAIHGK